jgi:hypothetical protein
MDVALVDLDYAELDVFRARLADRLAARGGDASAAFRARVRLVLAESVTSPASRWAGLCGAPRAGEAGRLGEVVVDAVIVSAHSPRKDAVLRLAASLGAAVFVLPLADGESRAQEAQP